MKHKTAAIISIAFALLCYFALSYLLVGTPGEEIGCYYGGLSTDEDWIREPEYYPAINYLDGLHRFIYLICIAVFMYTYYQVIQSYRQYIRK